MKIGTRVLVSSVQKTNQYFLGIVTDIEGSSYKVLLDSGKDASVSESRITPFNYFREFVKKPLPKSWVTENQKLVKSDNYDIHSLFLQKKAVVLTLPLLTCMWYWANAYVFQKKLTPPTLRTRTRSRSASALYSYKKTGDTLSVSPALNSTYFEIFGSLLHEMVHQYNYRIDWLQNRTFDPASGAHGKSFFKWRGPLAEIAGVKLTKMHSASDIDIEDAEEAHEKAKTMHVLIAELPRKELVASKAEEREDLLPLFNFLRARTSSVPKLIEVNNPALYNSITSVKSNSVGSGQKTPKGYISRIPERLRDLLLKA